MKIWRWLNAFKAPTSPCFSHCLWGFCVYLCFGISARLAIGLIQVVEAKRFEAQLEVFFSSDYL